MKRLALLFAAVLTMLSMSGLVFAQDTTLTITSSGNVGIGTTTPTYKLEVEGNFRALNPNADFTFDGFGAFNNTTLAATFSGFNGYGPQLRFEGAPVGFMDIGQDSSGNFVIESQDIPRVLVQPSGNVGIGTTSPSSKLHVLGSATITDNAMIGTTTTQFGARLEVADRVNVVGTGTSRVFIGQSGSNWLEASYNAAFARGQISTGSNTQPLILQRVGGRVGIGTDAPDQLLSVNGNASKVGGGTWATFSDRRVKKDIKAFSDGLSVINAIRPVTFRYNGKLGYPTDKTYVGVIAQEIQSVAPYTVDSYRAKLNPDDAEETDVLRFDGTALTYIAINAIKELDAKVEEILDLQKENQNLSVRLAELEALVKSLAAKEKSVDGKLVGELR